MPRGTPKPGCLGDAQAFCVRAGCPYMAECVALVREGKSRRVLEASSSRRAASAARMSRVRAGAPVPGFDP